MNSSASRRKSSAPRGGTKAASPRRTAATSAASEGGSDADVDRKGKIITFYSYKGGTGRSMSLANIAWLLACAGHRVLALDWDFEAPGLHRYFLPFLEDPELRQTRGVLDFFWEFAEASRVQAELEAGRKSASSSRDGDWFLPFADLTRYAVSLDYDFPKQGATLDFVCAGRQDATYSLKASTFGWNDFYAKLGGGVFLQHAKRFLRADYDYILIDSRTGLSDTSGICTVQMPDELMVFYTLNRQSVLGAAAVADSVRDQRRLPTGAPGIPIWPVATRLDPFEKKKLDLALAFGANAFREHLWQLTRNERASYWAKCNVPYIAFYGYEEVLAAFVDNPKSPRTMLSAMEILAGCLVGKPAVKLATAKRSGTETTKEISRVLKAFSLENVQALPGGSVAGSLSGASVATKIFVSYSRRDITRAEMGRITAMLGENSGVQLLWDEEVGYGENLLETLEARLQSADIVVCIVGKAWLQSKYTTLEYKTAELSAKRIIPVVLVDSVSWAELPASLSALKGVSFSQKNFVESVDELFFAVSRTIQRDQAAQPATDPDDPQKGKWGGRSLVDGRELSAEVEELSRHWFKVILRVERKSGGLLKGPVVFHLHDSFASPTKEVAVKNGNATLTLHCYGAFTVGVEADAGRTRLELDLAKLPKAPKIFRES